MTSQNHPLQHTPACAPKMCGKYGLLITPDPRQNLPGLQKAADSACVLLALRLGRDLRQRLLAPAFHHRRLAVAFRCCLLSSSQSFPICLPLYGGAFPLVKKRGRIFANCPENPGSLRKTVPRDPLLRDGREILMPSAGRIQPPLYSRRFSALLPSIVKQKRRSGVSIWTIVLF